MTKQESNLLKLWFMQNSTLPEQGEGFCVSLDRATELINKLESTEKTGGVWIHSVNREKSSFIECSLCGWRGWDFPNKHYCPGCGMPISES